MDLSQHIFITCEFPLKAEGKQQGLSIIYCIISFQFCNKIKTKSPFDLCITFYLLKETLAEEQQSRG